MHVFSLGSTEDYARLVAWDVQIVREFIGNLREVPLSGQWASLTSNGQWLWPLQAIVDSNRLHGLITILCPFGWVDASGVSTVFSGEFPRNQAFYMDYLARMRQVANQFAGQSDVWIEIWNEPYPWDNSGGYSNDIWLSDAHNMSLNLRSVEGFTNIMVVPGNGQGQLEDSILNKGAELLAENYNMVFDLHAYENWMIGTTSVSIRDRLETLKVADMAVIFGECGVINQSGLMNYSTFLSQVLALKIPALACLWKYDQTDQNALLTRTGSVNNKNNSNWGTGFQSFLMQAAILSALPTQKPTSRPSDVSSYEPTTPIPAPSHTPSITENTSLSEGHNAVSATPAIIIGAAVGSGLIAIIATSLLYWITSRKIVKNQLSALQTASVSDSIKIAASPEVIERNPGGKRN